MAIKSNRETVTVGIVGGGPGGLTVARMLEMFNISYRLFEAHEIIPETGASIGLMPTGLRILDQIGAYEECAEWSIRHNIWEHRNGETGELISTSKAFRALPIAFGYEGYFMERKHILEAIYNTIEDKSRLEPFKKVVEIEHLEDRAVIKTADGDSLSCQIVVGADGVHSVSRKYLRSQLPAEITPAPDYLTADAFCVFGISDPHPLIGEGRHFTIYRPGSSMIAFTGKGGKFFWFIFQDLEKPIPYGERKKYNDDEIKAACEECKDVLITDNVPFSELHKRMTYNIALPLEEGICESFHGGRVALVGDATHKMTPHAAMGANSAFESAACLVNKLVQERESSDNPNLENLTLPQINRILESYGTQRRNRVTPLVQLAGNSQRIQLRKSANSNPFIQHLPEMTEQDWMMRSMITFSQAEKLEYCKTNSKTVEHYGATAKTVLDALSVGKEKEFINSFTPKVNWD